MEKQEKTRPKVVNIEEIYTLSEHFIILYVTIKPGKDFRVFRM